MNELDRVLGGGLVCGSAVLISGEPGIGKSTLLLQICSELAKSRSVLYVSGEESKGQLKLRAERLGITGDTHICHLLSKALASDSDSHEHIVKKGLQGAAPKSKKFLRRADRRTVAEDHIQRLI